MNMDCNKVGKLIADLRKEQKMTQKQLADLLNISDKAISKWERGLGCADVSLWQDLSQILGVNIEKILSGELEPNSKDGGNMKKVKFFVCPSCGNIITSTGEAEVSCCGRKLNALVPQPSDEKHHPHVEVIEEDYYVTFSHEMSKEHYLNFVAYVSYDRILLVKLYSEQNAEVRFPKLHGGKFYFGCNRHGLWVSE